ncbi:hypothetical protein FA13DRAFT_151352 [Coprinellus micaceus]|uniref:F-box domain-containing protein n=1 Tax=Coprinellus micaceus TaxID=71717 RepID=A0A4Y7THB5_COPMI|nr:hypothetical protein FA13DRAFT_151352 [Coprinellus micaceus]
MSIVDLPNELLLAIFENLVNSSSPSFADPPSRISEVCQHWRSQSLLIPDLRAVLPLVTVGTTSRTLKGPLNTGATPSFAVRGVSSRHKKDPDFLKAFAKSTQWGHVELLDLHHDMLRPISTQLVSDVPLLHTLKLNINAGEHDYAGYLYASEEAPALRRLELECPARILFKAPFDQLEEYVERSTSSIGIGRILHSESKIQSLSYYSFPSTAASLPHDPQPSSQLYLARHVTRRTYTPRVNRPQGCLRLTSPRRHRSGLTAVFKTVGAHQKSVRTTKIE